jgi:hypothetical protein
MKNYSRPLSGLFQAATIFPLLGSLFAGVGAADAAPIRLNIPLAATAAATRDLDAFRHMMDIKGTLQLGRPLPVFEVGLEALSNYAGGPVAGLLDPIGDILYPILQDGKIIAQETVSSYGGQWGATGFSMGGYFFTLAGEQARTGPGVFEVYIPALSDKFLAAQKNGQLMLTPVLYPPGQPLQAGKTGPAEDIFRRLQPYAAKIDPSAPDQLRP